MPFYPNSSSLTQFVSAIAGLSTFFLSSIPAWSQTNRFSCPPPNPGEYMVFVRTPNPSSQQLLLNYLLPSNQTAQICQYNNEIVTQIRNLANAQVSERWSQYIYENTGLPAFMVAPPLGQIGTRPFNPPVLPSNPGSPLGSGFAVLVNANNRQDAPQQLQILLNKAIPWVNFQGNSYLLALQSSNQEEATATLMSLSDRGFLAILVDARQVQQLTPNRR
ncbi:MULTISPECIES: hypothetical protein [unclassified Roseofilum]|uniref:hypothetical protein n=1 Tax=unclassified Roseofilum TaxID=2620099 RepID=UPI000E8281AD|nr:MULTISPECIES: hypothetical protein [unclassified Roseofilum]MBP0007611.1 hypothetical protein [Roseofilum sp. Belize Diploria]MBP0034140.1 hypothetical protein [Roseofilum sp. Belize BBD 4]HBQ98600.1 hypothetical protein [Cyanobacteria bacterium UBA11691]